MRIHELKIWPEFFEAVAAGVKTAEFRQNDRGFEVGDKLHLREWSQPSNEYSGREKFATVTHIVHGGRFGLPAGYCVMSIVLDSPVAKLDAAPDAY